MRSSILLIAILIGGFVDGHSADPSARQDLWRKLEPYTRPPAEFAEDLGPYHSPFMFADGTSVKTPADWARRREEILAMWHRRLGEWPPLVERPGVKRLETVARDGHTEHHVHVQVSSDGHVADGYLLVPDGEGPFPAVLVPFYEPLTSIGQGENGKGRGTHDYGLQLVRRGFVTLSIGTPGSVENIGLETRQLLVEAGARERRQPLTLLAYVAANCHTALAQMQEVDRTRIGIVGLSYGGKWSMFSSCLYDKFACAVWSDPGIVFNESNANVNYWEPWYLGYDAKTQRKPGVPSDDNPRTGLYKELVDAGDDLVELHALMAPRPLLVSGGTEDPPKNWRALNHLVAVNDLLGHTHRVAMTARNTHVPSADALELELAFLEYWLSAPADQVVVVAGGGKSEADGVPATEARLHEPFAVDFDAARNMYIAELEGGRVLKVTPDGELSRVAGQAEKGDAGDGGPASVAVFNGMHHLLTGPDGNLLIADTWNNRVRRLDLAKDSIGPLAGTGSEGFSGDGGAALKAQFGGIYCLALSPAKETLYMVDLDNRRVRALDFASGKVFTVAGNGEQGAPADGAKAISAPLVDPRAVAVDSKGNVYILERRGNALRVVNREGVIRTVVGTGEAGNGGDGGAAREAQLNGPKHLCVDADDNVLIADTENHTIRKYVREDGTIVRIAGTGKEGAAGVGGPALSIELSRPHGVALGPDGHLYLSDSGNGRILKIVP